MTKTKSNELTKTESNEMACQSSNGSCESSSKMARKPKYKVRQNEGNWLVDVEVPGVRKGDVEVGFEDGILEIKAHREHSVPEGWRPLTYAATSDSDYRLRLEVGEEIDVENISAKLEDGVLHLDLPVSDAVKPRSIAVE